MTATRLHVMGVSTNEETTSWCLLTVPRASIFGNEKANILEWGTGRLEGQEEVRALALARLAREIQSLDYKVGVAFMIADPAEDAGPDAERLSAMLCLLSFQKLLADATINFQDLFNARLQTSDPQLKKWGLFTPGDDWVQVREATVCALAGLRYASQAHRCANVLWPQY